MFFQRHVMILLLLALLLAACAAPTATVTPFPQPTEVAQIVEARPMRGGTIVFPISQDPRILNSYVTAIGDAILIANAIYEGLTDIGPDGAYYPRLARELPTRENGGVSEDGLTITWKLREGVVWSDGKPFTSADVRFTWKAVTHPNSAGVIKYSQGWDLIDSVETPDDYTVIVHYREYYFNYLDQFLGEASGGILPKHACGDPASMLEWECNRHPVGTGPFMLGEWRAGESVTLVRNPNYREVGKPYLDEIVFPVVPVEIVRMQMMLKGEADALVWFSYEYADELKAAGMSVTPGSDQWLLRLGFNLSRGGDPNVPHPILTDKRVRKAIQLAIDPQLINSGILDGKGKAVAHELSRGQTVCPEPNIQYGKEGSRSLLTEAGWVDRDGDGIRECHGCLYAQEGDKMSMETITWPDSPIYDRIQQLIADELADVGIELKPNVAEDFLERCYSGDYDVAFWDDGYSSTPAWLLGTYYHSSNIPTKEGGGTGGNVFRFKSSEFDTLFTQARTTKDSQERLSIFCEIDRILLEELPSVWLGILPSPDAFSARLQGWTFNPNIFLTWDTANWWIRE